MYYLLICRSHNSIVCLSDRKKRDCIDIPTQTDWILRSKIQMGWIRSQSLVLIELPNQQVIIIRFIPIEFGTIEFSFRINNQLKSK